MRVRTSTSLVLTFLLMCALHAEVYAQALQPVSSPYYAKAYLGIGDYLGDRTDWNAGSFSTLGPSLGGELGVMVVPPWASIAVQGGFARFSDITRSGVSGPGVSSLSGSGGRSRLSVSLLGRLHVPEVGPLRIYGHMGPAFMFGWVNNGPRVGFGPRLGAGGDIPFRDKLRLFGEFNTLFVLPDEAADLAQQDDNEHDLLLFFEFGVRYALARPQDPLRVVEAAGPSLLQVGEAGEFRGLVNRAGGETANMQWDFGDGQTATGTTVSHVFQVAGSYTVALTASEGKKRVIEYLDVVVQAPIEAPSITEVQLSATPHHAGNRLQFKAAFESETTSTCVWDFGDSSYAKGCETSHIYAVPGVYTLNLEVANAGGTDRFSQTVYVRAPEDAACIAELSLESAFFDTNASALNVTARTALRRNLAALLGCPSARIQINGYALPNEQGPESLAERRAEAVQNYYTTSGLLQTRIVAGGIEVVHGLSASDPQWQYRFAESVAVKAP